ncbi:MAG: metallophosphoesterase [Candidatus Izemoplasmatales bacterium]
MGFIQETKIQINLGVSKEYTLIQFSDVHAVTYDKISDESELIIKAINQEKLWMQQRLDFAEKFQENYDSNKLFSSIECLNQLIDYANKQNPDLVILTGDIIDYYSPTNFAYLKKTINRIKSSYLFSCGNHEYPSRYFFDMCQGNCDINYIDFKEFMVISIDDSIGKIKPNQLNAFKMLLRRKIPIILAMHIPIMTEYNREKLIKLDSYYSIKYNDCDDTTLQFIRLVSTRDEIKAILCGHTHGSITSMVAPNKPQYCCSSGLIGFINRITIK